MKKENPCQNCLIMFNLNMVKIIRIIYASITGLAVLFSIPVNLTLIRHFMNELEINSTFALLIFLVFLVPILSLIFKLFTKNESEKFKRNYNLIFSVINAAILIPLFIGVSFVFFGM